MQGLLCYSKHALLAGHGPFLYYPNGFIHPFTYWMYFSDWSYCFLGHFFLSFSLPLVTCSQCCCWASPGFWSCEVSWTKAVGCSVLKHKGYQAFAFMVTGLCSHLLHTLILGLSWQLRLERPYQFFSFWTWSIAFLCPSVCSISELLVLIRFLNLPWYFLYTTTK